MDMRKYSVAEHFASPVFAQYYHSATSRAPTAQSHTATWSRTDAASLAVLRTTFFAGEVIGAAEKHLRKMFENSKLAELSAGDVGIYLCKRQGTRRVASVWPRLLAGISGSRRLK